VSSIVYDPNGDFVISAGEDHTIRFWDPKTGAMIGDPLEGHTKWVNELAIHPEGTMLASAGHDNTIRLWDTKAKKQIGLLMTLENDRFSVSGLDFSPDGKRLMALTSDGKFWFWNTETLALESDPVDSGYGLFNIGWNPDLSEIYTAWWTGEQSLKILDAETGELISEPGFDDVVEIECSPDGTILAIAQEPEFREINVISFWDLEKGELIASTESRHESTQISDMEFSPSGKYMFSVNNDLIEVWDPKTGVSKGVFLTLDKTNVNNAGNKLEISPDGNMILSADDRGTIRMWRVFSNRQDEIPLADFEGGGSFAVSEDGQYLAASARLGEEYGIYVWSLPDLSHLTTMELESSSTSIPVFKMTFLQDNILAAGGSGFEDTTKIYFYDPENPEALLAPIEIGSRMLTYGVDSGRQRLMVISKNEESQYKYRIWDLTTREELIDETLDLSDMMGVSFESDDKLIRNRGFSQDGEILAIIDNENYLYLWSTQKNQLLSSKQLDLGESLTPVKHLQFSPDHSLLALALDEGLILIVDVTTGEPFNTVLPIRPNWASTMLFNQDSSILFSGGVRGNIQQWDLASKQPIGKPISSSSARHLAYEMPGFDLFFGIKGHSSYLYDLILVPGEKQLLSLDNEGNIKIWELDIDTLIDRACTRAGRNLTEEEWNLYLPFDEYRKTCPQYP
jgi:WD40 repeat protein